MQFESNFIDCYNLEIISFNATKGFVYSMAEIFRVSQYSLSILSSSKEIAILKDINLSIEQGEIVGLIGQSGSGKSLFGLSVADLLYLIKTKLTGEICYKNSDGEYENIIELPAKELIEYRRAFVSMIFQDALSALNPAKTCGWQINESIRFALPALTKQERRALALQMIKDVELADADRVYASYPHELSGGQLQRVMIAMAIVGKPQLIIADEPTSSLDKETESTIIRLLKKLQAVNGFALVFISHDIDLVKTFCNRIAIMDKGQLVEVRDTKDLFTSPQTQAAKDLIRKRTINKIEGEYSDQVFLQVKQLSHYYGKRNSLFGKERKIHSLDNVSFTLNHKEILGLMGQSGSGKSTIAKILTGFEYPAAGEIYLDEVNLVEMWRQSPRQLRKRIQVIFQNPFSSLNPLQTIKSSVSEVLRLHHGLSKIEIERELIRLLETVGLSDEFLSRYPRQLSGGEQQRVSIARALAVKPELLICDECVSALDTITKYDLMDLLRSLRDNQDLSILFISHDLEAIDYVSDRAIHLRDGQLIPPSLQSDNHSKIL